MFSGSDVVDWLYSHVEGFQDRREARKYACNLLKVMSNLCFNTVTGFFHQIISGDVILKTIFKFEENHEFLNILFLDTNIETSAH